MTNDEKVAVLRNALGVLLGDMDFTRGACSPSEAVGAVVNPISLVQAQNAMRDTA